MYSNENYDAPVIFKIDDYRAGRDISRERGPKLRLFLGDDSADFQAKRPEGESAGRRVAPRLRVFAG